MCLLSYCVEKLEDTKETIRPTWLPHDDAGDRTTGRSGERPGALTTGSAGQLKTDTLWLRLRCCITL